MLPSASCRPPFPAGPSRNIVSRRKIAGERRGDRAHLFITGEQKEGRRASVALYADRVDPRFGMTQFAMTMRVHGPHECRFGSIDGRAPWRSQAKDRARGGVLASATSRDVARWRR